MIRKFCLLSWATGQCGIFLAVIVFYAFASEFTSLLFCRSQNLIVNQNMALGMEKLADYEFCFLSWATGQYEIFLAVNFFTLLHRNL